MKFKHPDGTVSECNPQNEQDEQALEAQGLVKVEEVPEAPKNKRQRG